MSRWRWRWLVTQKAERPVLFVTFSNNLSTLSINKPKTSKSPSTTWTTITLNIKYSCGSVAPTISPTISTWGKPFSETHLLPSCCLICAVPSGASRYPGGLRRRTAFNPSWFMQLVRRKIFMKWKHSSKSLICSKKTPPQSLYLTNHSSAKSSKATNTKTTCSLTNIKSDISTSRHQKKFPTKSRTSSSPSTTTSRNSPEAVWLEALSSITHCWRVMLANSRRRTPMNEI